MNQQVGRHGCSRDAIIVNCVLVLTPVELN